MAKKRHSDDLALTPLYGFYWIVIKEMWDSVWDATRWFEEKIAMTVFLLGVVIGVVMLFNYDIGSAVASWFNTTWVGFHPAWAVIPLVAIIFHAFVMAMRRKYNEIELANLGLTWDINREGVRIPVLHIVSHGLAVSENLISRADAQGASLDDLAMLIRGWLETIHDNLDEVSTVDALHFADAAIMDDPASRSDRQILMTIVSERVARLRQIEQRYVSVSPPTPDTPRSPKPT